MKVMMNLWIVVFGMLMLMTACAAPNPNVTWVQPHRIDIGVVIGLIIAGTVLVVFGLFFWLSRKDKQRGTRFMGVQLDIATLIVVLVLLLALIGWVHETFFR